MLAVGLGGAALSAVSSYGQAQATAANASYQAQVAANNAKIATVNAGMDTQSGEIAAVNQGMKTRAAIGATKAAEGASGVSVNSGSFPQVRASEAELGMLDAMTIRSNAAKQAYAAEVQATSSTAESQLLTAESSEASSIAPVSALGTFLGGASSVGGNYLRYSTGAPPGGGGGLDLMS